MVGPLKPEDVEELSVSFLYRIEVRPSRYQEAGSGIAEGEAGSDDDGVRKEFAGSDKDSRSLLLPAFLDF